MKEKVETNNQCEFCKRTFIRESTMYTHLCEQKRRWNDRDKQVNRFAHNAWKLYYNKNHPSKKKTEYIDFIHNSFYSAFIRFANYCITSHVINIPRYIDYLVSHKVVIDNWNSDVHYTKFLIEYLRLEDAHDALNRSIECLTNLSKEQNILLKDVFKFVNYNVLCHYIVNGKLSAWLLYQSKEGIHFIEQLNQDQIKLIYDYINPDLWNIKFHRNSETVLKIKKYILELGL